MCVVSLFDRSRLQVLGMILWVLLIGEGVGAQSIFEDKAPPANKTAETIDLLRLLDLDHDVIKGRWERAADGVECIGDRESRIRIPYRPPAEYDFITEFTVKKFGDFSDVNLMCSANDRGFIFIFGAWERLCALTNVNGLRFEGNPTAVNRPGTVTLAHRQRAVVQVRSKSIRAFVDDNLISQWTPKDGELACDGGWVVGSNVLGFGANDQMTFHSVTIKEVTGTGRRIERTAPPGRDHMVLIGHRLKPLSLLELKPVSAQVGWGKFLVNAHPDSYDVILNGKRCDHYLCAHAPSSVFYDVPQGAVVFSASGLRTPNSQASFRYVVCIDGESTYEAFVSKNVRDEAEPIMIETLLPPGSKRIELRVDVVGENASKAHGLWLEPRFLIDEGTVNPPQAPVAAVKPPVLPETAGPKDLEGSTLHPHPAIDPLVGHKKDVYRIVFSPNGRWMASCSEDGQVVLWECATGKELNRFDQHQSLRGLAFDRTGKILVSAGMSPWGRGASGSAVIRNLETNTELPIWSDSAWTFDCVSIDPTGRFLALGGADRALRLFDLNKIRRGKDGKMTASDAEIHPPAPALSGEIRSLAFHPKRLEVVAGCADGSIRQVKLDDKGAHLLKPIFDGHPGEVRCVTFSPDGKFLASCGIDGKIRLWDADNGILRRTIDASTDAVNWLAFSPDGKMLASAQEDKRVGLWRVSDGTSLLFIEGHTAGVLGVDFSRDGQHLASCGRDFTVRLWTLFDPKDSKHPVRP